MLGGLILKNLGNTALWAGCFGLSALLAAGNLAARPARSRRIARLQATEACAC